MKLNEKQFLIVIFAAALVLRITFVLLARDAGLSYDEVQYDLIASNLLAGKGFAWYEEISTTFRAPLYPFFLAFSYSLFGKSYLIVRIIQAILGASLPVIGYLICRDVFNVKTARISALILTFYVPFILYTIAFLTENLFLPLMGLAVLLLVKYKDREQIRYCALCGVFLGLSILTRPSLVAFIPILFLWFYYPVKNLRLTLRNSAVVLVVIMILITPWTIRNSLAAGQFVFLDSKTGYNLYVGYNPNATGTFNWESVTVLNEIVDDTERHNWGMENAVDYIKNNPLDSARLVPKKFFYFWDLDKREFISAYSWNYIGELPAVALALVFSIVMIPFPFIVIFGTIGVTFSVLTKKTWLILLIICYYTLLYSVTLAESRMHMVLVPFIVILAANGLCSIGRIKSALSSPDKILKKATIKRIIVCVTVIAIFIWIWVYGISMDLEKFRIIFSEGGNTSYLPY